MYTLAGAAIVVALAGTLLLPAIAPTPVLASGAAIEGCWDVVAFADEPQLQLCFRANNRLDVAAFLPGEPEGADSSTTYRLDGADLIIEGNPTAAFGFPASEQATCKFSVVDVTHIALTPCASDWPAVTLLRRAEAADGLRQRPASAATMDAALRGCWSEESATQDRQIAGFGDFYNSSICFEQGNKVTTGMGGGSDGMFEIAEATGTYRLAGDKLHMKSNPASNRGWPFEAAEVACDARASAGERLQLQNCSVAMLGRGYPAIHGRVFVYDRSLETKDMNE